MAKQGITLPELKRALSSGPPALIYLVVGEEPFLRDAAVAEIQQHVLGPDVAGVAAFNMDVLYGADTDALEILRLCDTLPAFAERRLLIVRDAGALKARETERLLPYLNTPVETTCFVMTSEKVDGRIKFFQTLKSVGVTVDCSPLDPRSMGGWIREQATILALNVDDGAIEALRHASGGALGVVRRELEKLAAYVMPKIDVTVADVEAVRGADTGGTVWDLLDALARKDRAAALRALGKVLEAGDPPLRLLGLLSSSWRQVWKVREQLGRRVPEAGLARAVGVPPFRVPGLVRQARAFSEGDMGRSFEAFREADSQLKSGGRGHERRAMERLVLALCGSAEKPTPSRSFAPVR